MSRSPATTSPETPGQISTGHGATAASSMSLVGSSVLKRLLIATVAGDVIAYSEGYRASEVVLEKIERVIIIAVSARGHGPSLVAVRDFRWHRELSITGISFE